ncbi:MAG: right-handed parallel beta-helix repeat-containing protein [Planctomycetes bacterium]|nr:right-handed parallel beta-helix repeat-containing protein [Planctomycetota bacterium]
MFHPPARAILAALALLCSAPPCLFAQSSFYVDGQSGLDVPGNGSSTAAPWKTISYALSRITPPTQVQSVHTLHLAGGQVYSPATNGESFPLTMLYNVALLGSSTSSRAILSPRSSESAIVFDRGTIYNRNQVTLRNLEIRGAQVGALMGGNPGIRHRPRFWNCVFDGQAQAGVRIDERGNQITDPRFFQCIFRGNTGAPGIDAFAQGDNAVVRPDIEECEFTGSGRGIQIRDTSGAGSDVGGIVAYSTFQGNTAGVFLLSGNNAFLSRLEVRSSHFRSCGDGISIQVGRPYDPLVTVESCVFLQCGYGYRLNGNFTPGQYSFTLRSNVARHCFQGFRHEVRGTGDVRIFSENNLALENQTEGFVVDHPLDDAVNLVVDSVSDRALCNTGYGFFCWLGPTSTSSLRLVNGVFAGNGYSGLLFGGGNDVAIQTSTMADNARYGVHLESRFPSRLQVDHCIVANNTWGELNQSFPIAYSCFQNQTHAGTGNLRTDPQLFRPHYKLQPTSPCIDAGNRAARIPSPDYEGDPRPLLGRLGSQGGPDLGADEWNPNGNAVPVGVAGFGADGFHPTIATPSTRFTTNSTFHIDLRGAIDFWQNLAQIGILTVGLNVAPSPAAVFDLGLLGAPSSYLWIDPLSTIGPYPVGPGGSISLPVSIPANGIFIGQVYTAQWWVLKLGTNPASIVTTDALRITIG